MNKFIINHKSIFSFFRKHMLTSSEQQLSEDRFGNYTHLFQKEVFMNKACGIEVGQVVEIRTEDMINGSREKIDVTYLYTTSEYDSINLVLVMDTKTLKISNDRV